MLEINIFVIHTQKYCIFISINSTSAQDLSLKYLLGSSGGGIPEDILTNSEFAQLIFPSGWSNANNVIVTLDEDSVNIFNVIGDSTDKMFLSIKSPVDYESTTQYQVRIKVLSSKLNILISS